MKKIIVIAVTVLILGGFIVFQKMQASSVVPSNTPLATETPKATEGYKNGIYTGAVGSASQYGDVQVKITISKGKITTVDVIKFPNTPGNTTKISNGSLPVLKQEAIAAQSAKIDNVTGATQTTEGFVQSLQSALDQAKV